MTADQVETDRRRLVRAAHCLEKNADFMLLRKKLFTMEPPLERPAFTAADNFNAHAAAFRDGASSVTRWLMNLSMSEPVKDEEEARPGAAKAEFGGE